MPARGAIWIGTSGYAYRHWRGVLYPEGLPARRWLERYAGQFATVELNTTFYALPSEASVDRWRDETPPGFRFACKGSRYLTHHKRLTELGAGIANFYDRVGRLGDKLAVVLWQLPPGMRRADPERLDAFLSALPRELRHAVEFRHDAWYTPAICDLLAARGAAFCEHDMLPARPPRATGGFRYVRLHGTTSRYSGRYGEAGLRPLADDLAGWRAGGRDAFVYFNNDLGGHAVRDAGVLAGLLG